MNEQELMDKAKEILAGEDYDILKAILNLPSKSKPPVKRSLQEHYLKAVYVCKTCKSIDQIFYKMKHHSDCNCLVSEPVSTLSEEVKLEVTDIHTINTPVCRKCREFLQTLTKEEVIDKLINVLSKP